MSRPKPRLAPVISQTFLSVMGCPSDFDAPVSPARLGSVCQNYRNSCLKRRSIAENGNGQSRRVLQWPDRQPERKARVAKQPSLNTPRSTATSVLACAIAGIAQSDGDYPTAVPALSLHRRQMPTEPVHCIYGLGLGIVAQGGKQVMLGGDVMDYGPGQSMLTTIDLPVVAHVTRASAREPFLGMMLTFEAHTIVQLAGDIELTPIRKDQGYRSLSIETLDAA